SAVEAMVGTLVPADRPVLVCANGVYGERIDKMLRLQGKQPILLRQDWTEAIDLEAVATRLADNPDISSVIAVHHETTTGRLNDLEALGAVCREYETPMLVDAVSSFGGAQLPLERWNAVACASNSNKCLHGVPGVAFVLARRDLLTSGTGHAPGLYLDLITNFNAQVAGYPAFTPAVQAMYALHQALVDLEAEGGWQARAADYAERTGRLVTGLAALGIEPLLDEGRSDILTSFRLPLRTTFDELYAHLRAENFVIYAGQKQMFDSIFRVAVMGDLHLDEIDRLVHLVSEV
ncbi:MAG: aminotransferase class V-fold PLP-dependent enzyme, partial [Acidimicrobiia bacterium]|nr:aminotransferase class V-fold PLP-dependent enzyme [Acidimicrobiia bacterium]